MRLTQALIFVRDLPQMQRFYRDLLGLAVLEECDGHARYGAADAALALHAIPPEHAPTEDDGATREDGAIKLTFTVADVDGERARLVGAGVAMREPWSWEGLRACDGVDPEGNVFQIAARTAD